MKYSKKLVTHGDQFQKKLHEWQAARGDASGKDEYAEQWLIDLCHKLPEYTDNLLAWFIGCSLRPDGHGGFEIGMRSKNWAGLIGQFLFPRVSPRKIAASLGGRFTLHYENPDLSDVPPVVYYE